MNDWTGGYVADVAYQPGVYIDQMPSHLDMICNLEGVHAPREPGAPFRYAELGCGLGETALLIAALHPEADVVGYDFNPAHISHARAQAQAVGLPNIRFEERSFGELAALTGPEHANFDYVALHGIWTWVTRERQREIVEILNTRLRPGGIAYVTYNALPYWSEILPFQRLVLDLAASAHGRSDERIHEALDVVADIEGAGAAIIRKGHLEMVLGRRSHDGAYLAHEYLNENSRPVYHADVARDLAGAKLDFVGSGIALDNFPDLMFDAEQRAVLERLPPHLRVTVGDYFYPHLFRRDVFVRGVRPMERMTRTGSLLDRTLMLTVAPNAFETKLANARHEIAFDAPFYAFLVEELARGPATLRQVYERFGPGEPPDPREVIAFGAQSGQILTTEPVADMSVIGKVNRAIVADALKRMRSSAFIAAAAARSAIELNVPAMLVYLALSDDPSSGEAAILDRAETFLEARGARLRKTAGGQSEDEMRKQIGDILAKRVPNWRRYQAL